MYQHTSQPHMNNYAQSRNVGKRSSDLSESKCPDVKSNSSEKTPSYSPTIPTLPLCFQFNSIHPAFPFPASPQPPIIGPQLLAAYYKSLAQSSSQQNVVFVPSTRLSADSHTETGSSTSLTLTSSLDSSFPYTDKLQTA